MWIETAQIKPVDGHGWGEKQDPHGVRALEEADAAFDAAKQGSEAAQLLGALAHERYEGRTEGDFYATVADFLALCGDSPPPVSCLDGSICEMNRMDSYAES